MKVFSKPTFVYTYFSCVQFFATLWTVACQAPLFMGFSRQEYWSGLPCPSPRDLPNPGIEPASLRSCALASVFYSSTTWEAPLGVGNINKFNSTVRHQPVRTFATLSSRAGLGPLALVILVREVSGFRVWGGER